MSGPSLIILAAGRARRFGGVKPLAPIGPNGEGVLDLIASDAYGAGFGHVVVVINPDTGPVIQEHVAANWPAAASVSFAVQERPLGTVHAVLSARGALDDSLSFAVCNADDLYGRDAFATLGAHLQAGTGNCLVGFRLDHALVGDQPVTRGVCEVADGRLVGIAERRQVVHADGRYVSHDGLDPAELGADRQVSMNLWGFLPSMWDVFAKAMADATDASEDKEVLLPEIVGTQINVPGMGFAVLTTDARCIGVTHPDDLAVVQADVAAQVTRGEREAVAFSTLR